MKKEFELSIINRITDSRFADECLRITEAIFLVLTGFYLACLTLKTTMFSFSVPEAAEFLFPLLFTLVTLPRVVVQLKNRYIWFSLLVYIIFQFVWEAEYLPILAIMTVGCVGIPYRKVLKVYLISVGGVVAGTVIAALSGGVAELVYIRHGYIRSALGINYPTDLAALVFFLLLTFWVYRRDMKAELSLLISIVSLAVSVYLVRSRTSMLCSGAFIIIILYSLVEEKYIDKREGLSWIKKLVNILLQASFPVFAVFSVFILWGYAKGYTFAIVADNLMSHRLKWALRAYDEVGISAFGHPVSQTGAGSTTFSVLDYYFIDNSYHRFLLMYGMVTLILMCILWIIITRRSIKTGERRLALALCVIAFHAVSEHHFIQMFYNIFIILPFAEFNSVKSEKCERKRFYSTRRLLCYGCSLLTMILLPGILSRMRIVLASIKGTFTSFLCSELVLVLIVIWIISLSGLLEGLILHKRPSKQVVVITVTALVLSVLCFVRVNSIINVAYETYSHLMDEESGKLNEILEAKKGKVYVDRLGELYHDKFLGISRSILDGEDLARFSDVTVVTDKEFDSLVFKKKGFDYTQISDEHAIYTNDEGVKSALMGNGYRLTSYCTAEHFYNFEGRSAVLNDGCRSLIIDSEPERIREDDGKINLYFGTYSLNIYMITDMTGSEDDEICRVYITAFDGAQTVREVSLYRNEFDENGELNTDVIFKTGNYPNIQFKISTLKGNEVEVKSVSWRRSPKYDVHSIYDGKNLKIRDDFFDEDGKLTVTDDGYSSIRYSYDAMGLVNGLDYLDLNSRPVNTVKGYASIRSTYNVKKQKLRTEFFDIQGNRAKSIDGYAIREWAYDNDGYLVENRFYDEDEKPVETVYGYSLVRREYNEEHRLIAERYYGIDGERIMTEYGYSGKKMHYDEDGVLLKTVFIDNDDQPVLNAKGYAEVSISGSPSSYERVEEYYDTDGNPTMSYKGYASMKSIYAPAGDIYCYKYYDLKGELIDEIKGDGLTLVEEERDLRKDDSDTGDLDGFDPEED